MVRHDARGAKTLKLVAIIAGCGRKACLGKGRKKYAKGTLAHFKHLLTANCVPGRKVKTFHFLFLTLPFPRRRFKAGPAGTDS